MLKAGLALAGVATAACLIGFTQAAWRERTVPTAPTALDMSTNDRVARGVQAADRRTSADDARPVEGVSPPLAERFGEIGELLRAKRNLSRAEEQARALVDDVEAAYGRRSLITADAYDLFVRALYLTHQRVEFQWRGQDRSSVDFARDALRLREELLDDPHHPSLAVSLRNLGGMLQTNQQLDRAETALRGSLEIRQRAFGVESLEVSESLTWLSSLLTDQAQRLRQPQRRATQQRALQSVEQALRIREQRLGTHPEVAQTLTTMANLIWAMGEYRPAKEFYERALAIYEATAEDALIARGLSNLGEPAT